MHDKKQIKSTLERKTDEELLDMLAHSGDFQPNVLPIASEVLLSRGLSADILRQKSEASDCPQVAPESIHRSIFPAALPAARGLLHVLINMLVGALFWALALATAPSRPTLADIAATMFTLLTGTTLGPIPALAAGEQVSLGAWLPCVFFYAAAACVVVGVVRGSRAMRVVGHIVLTAMSVIPPLVLAALSREFRY
jgi:hypothetical protein